MPAAPQTFDAFRTPPSRVAASACARVVAVLLNPRLNPLLNVILAFWAQFHCRHARPPATALA
jgi:hypothetical protein